MWIVMTTIEKDATPHPHHWLHPWGLAKWQASATRTLSLGPSFGKKSLCSTFFSSRNDNLDSKTSVLASTKVSSAEIQKHDTSSDQMKHLVVVQSLMSWQEFLTCQASLVWEFSQTSSCFFWQWPSHWKRVGFAQCCNKRNTIASCSRFAYLVQAFRRNNTPCQFLFKSDLPLCLEQLFCWLTKGSVLSTQYNFSSTGSLLLDGGAARVTKESSPTQG